MSENSGQFKPGQSGNPKGRPSKPKEEKFYRTTLSAVTLADWREIVKKAVDQAKKGNPSARKWLSDYLIGPPQQKVDVTSAGEALDVRAWIKQAEQNATQMTEVVDELE
jgi:hypothetical protein